MTQRKFDPEALEEFMRVVRENLLKTIEDDLQPLMQEGGVLNKEPAFGQLEGSKSATGHARVPDLPDSSSMMGL